MTYSILKNWEIADAATLFSSFPFKVINKVEVLFIDYEYTLWVIGQFENQENFKHFFRYLKIDKLLMYATHN